MKIVIIGGVAGGASAAARARRLDESAEIIVLQSGPDVSFASCGMVRPTRSQPSGCLGLLLFLVFRVVFDEFKGLIDSSRSFCWFAVLFLTCPSTVYGHFTTQPKTN